MLMSKKSKVSNNYSKKMIMIQWRLVEFLQSDFKSDKINNQYIIKIMKHKAEKDERLSEYRKLKGKLEKKTSNFITGFQPKYWEVFDSGKKIAYRNLKDMDYEDRNIFDIRDCFVSEASGPSSFQLIVKDRSFLLKAESDDNRDQWVAGITYLKQYLYKKKKQKKTNLFSSSTLTNEGQSPRVMSNNRDFNPENSIDKSRKKKGPKLSDLNSTHQSIIHKSKAESNFNQNHHKTQKSNSHVKFHNKLTNFHNQPHGIHHQPDDLIVTNDKKISFIIQQIAKYLPKKHLKYNTFLTTLKTRQEGIFNKKKYESANYLLISPKSLYPNIYVNEQNLTNITLPPWAEINKFYEVGINSNGKCVVREICSVSQIIDVELCEYEDDLFRINTGEVLYEFIAENREQKECIKNCLWIGKNNADEVMINGKISKNNYDKLVYLCEISDERFNDEVLKHLSTTEIIKDVEQIIHFLQGVNSFIRNFLQVLANKNKKDVEVVIKTIQDTLKIVYQEVKIQVKISWDSLYPKCMIKTVHILSILQKLSDFNEITSNYIRSVELIQGMKQLSKIYVRDAWKHFQLMILSIVEQERKGSFYEDSQIEQNWIKTNGIIDLFKLLYDVYDIASPHWKSKIHLRNVNKLIQRALQIFVSEIRSLVDEQYLLDKQLLGIANNYFDLNEYTKQFYNQKFSKELHEKVEEEYEKIIKSYKQVSLVIVDKLARSPIEQLQAYLSNKKITKIKSEQIYSFLIEDQQKTSNHLHMAFKRKYYDKIAENLHLQIVELLEKEGKVAKDKKLSDKNIKKGKSKAKTKQTSVSITELAEYLRIINTDFIEIFKFLGKSHVTYSRFSKQILDLLTNQLHSDIKVIIESNTEPLKSKYLEILNLRKDYYQNSILYQEINQEVRQRRKSMRIRTPTANKRRKVSTDLSLQKNYKSRKASFTQQYFQEELYNEKDDNKSSISDLSNKNDHQKLISCGYMMKGKRNKKLFEKQYFRLKNGTLYIYENQSSERCSNNIPVKSITDLKVKDHDKPNFLLTYTNLLNTKKQIKFKCEDMYLRDRWVISLKLQMKRVSNQQKVNKRTAIKKIEADAGRKKNQFIIDYWELQGGTDYFSYSND